MTKKKIGPKNKVGLSLVQNNFPTNLTLTNNENKTAIIDIGKDKVSYSGELLVEESAKLFFDSLQPLIYNPKEESNG